MASQTSSTLPTTSGVPKLVGKWEMPPAHFQNAATHINRNILPAEKGKTGSKTVDYNNLTEFIKKLHDLLQIGG